MPMVTSWHQRPQLEAQGDILFDGSRCRNIMVDIRYVLWVMDVFAGAGHLVEEMTLVTQEGGTE